MGSFDIFCRKCIKIIKKESAKDILYDLIKADLVEKVDNDED